MQCEKLVVTHDLLFSESWERRTNFHILPAKTKQKKTRQFNFPSKLHSQTYTTNNIQNIDITQATLHCLLASVIVQTIGNSLIYATGHLLVCLLFWMYFTWAISAFWAWLCIAPTHGAVNRLETWLQLGHMPEKPFPPPLCFSVPDRQVANLTWQWQLNAILLCNIGKTARVYPFQDRLLEINQK